MLADKYGGEFDNPARASNYYHYESEFADYRKPMELSDIKTFERREHISVNVYRLVSEKSIDALQITKLNPDNVLNHIDLLKLNGGHYVLIRDFSRLARKQVTGHGHKHYICKRCLHMCQTERVLNNHIERCAMHKAQTVKMPTPTKFNPENTVHFTAIEKQLPLPFWFVADFEAICKPHMTVLPDIPTPDQPVRDEDGALRYSRYRNGDPEQGLRAGPSTTKISQQVPSGVAYQL